MVSLLERNKRGRLFGELARVGITSETVQPFYTEKIFFPKNNRSGNTWQLFSWRIRSNGQDMAVIC